MTTDTRYIKISGKIELEPNIKLEMDQEVTIICQGQCVKIEEGSNQNGTSDKVFKIKLTTASIQ